MMKEPFVPMPAMITAEQARARYKPSRMSLFNAAVEHAVSQGKQLCYLHILADSDEVSTLQSLGYNVEVDKKGVTWLYWFDEDRLDRS